MELNLLLPLVRQIHGCTFATLDAVTEPKPGLLHKVIGENVLIYRTNGKSGYEAKVKRKLAEAGYDPESFKVGDLPWGKRMEDLPIIENLGKYYLQTIQLSKGKEQYVLKASGRAVDPASFGIGRRNNPALPMSCQVIMKTFNISNLERITLLGKTIVTAEKATRSILSIKTN